MSTLTASNTAALARRLAALSLDPSTGAPGVERVRAVLSELETTRPPAALRPLLKAYQVALAREVAKSELHIEHAGPLPPETAALLAAHFAKLSGRRVTSVTRENPDLAVGLRVRVGDDVYDSSARGILARSAVIS
jgi:F-type H+-transporting ATPase subunit delta